MKGRKADTTMNESPYAPPAEPLPVFDAQPSFFDSPLRVAGIAVLVDAVISLLCMLAIGPTGFLFRTGFDVYIGLNLMKGNERFRGWAMLRGAIWLVYGFVNLGKGSDAWFDIAFSALFLVSMLGFLFGEASRTRVVLSSIVFAVYALGMIALLALIALAKANGVG